MLKGLKEKSPHEGRDDPPTEDYPEILVGTGHNSVNLKTHPKFISLKKKDVIPLLFLREKQEMSSKTERNTL